MTTVSTRRLTGKKNRRRKDSSVVKTATTAKQDIPARIAFDWWLALAGAVLIWACFPPLNIWPLAWVAPLPWLCLVRQPRLGMHRPYGKLYLVGLLHWLMLIQGVRLPHWSAYFGWLALAGYLAVYPPLYIGLSRVAVHTMRVPLWLAAPAVWCGLELARSYLFTGFAVALLGHTQVAATPIIQIADLGGAYAVSFLIMLVSAAGLELWPRRGSSRHARWLGPAFAAVAMVMTLVYGSARLATCEAVDQAASTTARVALIQGSIDTTFNEHDDPRDAFSQYLGLARQAVERYKPLDLIVWPESMYTSDLPLFTSQAPVAKPVEIPMSDDAFRIEITARQKAFRDKAAWMAGELGAALLVGTEVVHFSPQTPQRFNSALWIKPNGQLADRYDKMHPVMFGEYVPFGDKFPWLYRLTPMPGGLTQGKTSVLIKAGGVTFSPSICFENTVPHLIRRHVRTLDAKGDGPDVLVTITNDGWFWGSSLLDLHLACGVFRAVENRRPLLIAANTGFSAWIDRGGKIAARGPRRDKAILFAEVPAARMASRYLAWGDWFAGVCAIFCVVAMVLGLKSRENPQKSFHRNTNTIQKTTIFV
jgi:apolipoprotein N-acyltransferase